MMIPSKVKIGWKTYEVRHSEDELYGQIDYNACIITLRKANSAEQNKCTLIHEVLHGITEMFGIDLDEKTVTALANAIYTVMKENFPKKDRGGTPMRAAVAPAKHCGNCRRYKDDVDTCRLLNCHRAYGQKELENKDHVTDAWEPST